MLGVGPMAPFLLYINDMHRSSNQMRFVQVADYTTVFESDSDVNNVHATVNSELLIDDNWLKTNRFSLNVGKTSYMIISNQKNASEIKLQESILANVSTVRFLGVTLDENIAFNDYVKKSLLKYLSCWCHEETKLPVPMQK